MKLFFLGIILTLFSTHVAADAKVPETFHFNSTTLQFHYPYFHAERTHCIDMHEANAHKTYTGIVNGALNNPDLIREEVRLPKKLPRAHVPSLAYAWSEEEEGKEKEVKCGKDGLAPCSNHILSRSPLSPEFSFAECAFTNNSLLYFTTYPKDPLNKVHIGPSAEQPSLTPFESAVQVPLSAQLSTRIHPKLFYMELPSFDSQVELTVLARTQVALCLLPEVKFAHRGNAAHVRLQSLEAQLMTLRWTAPSHGAFLNVILCFLAFLFTVLVRYCLYIRLFDLNDYIDLINELLTKHAKFEPFTTPEHYELIAILDIQEKAEEPYAMSSEPAHDPSEKPFDMDDLF